MKDLTPKQKKRMLSEFVALEAKMDEVLFAKRYPPYDDEEDNGFPVLRTAATAAGVGGLGAGGYFGARKLAQRGAQINAPYVGMGPFPQGVAGEGGGITSLAPEAGFLKNVRTGAQAYGSQAKTSLLELLKRLRKPVAGSL
jgi:hypothetical protein